MLRVFSGLELIIVLECMRGLSHVLHSPLLLSESMQLESICT